MANYKLNYEYCPHCKGKFSFAKPISYDNCGGRGECPFCGYDIPNCWTYVKAKPKPTKVRRIKAWAIVRDLETGEIDGSFEAGNLPPKHFSSAYVPCTILINEKYLRGNK